MVFTAKLMLYDDIVMFFTVELVFHDHNYCNEFHCSVNGAECVFE